MRRLVATMAAIVVSVSLTGVQASYAHDANAADCVRAPRPATMPSEYVSVRFEGVITEGDNKFLGFRIRLTQRLSPYQAVWFHYCTKDGTGRDGVHYQGRSGHGDFYHYQDPNGSHERYELLVKVPVLAAPSSHDYRSMFVIVPHAEKYWLATPNPAPSNPETSIWGGSDKGYFDYSP